MFARQKKLPPPPKPPTLNQIIEDLETFKEDVGERESLREMPPNSQNPDRDFWLMYQTFVEDNKQLQKTYDTLEQMKYAIQTTVEEIKEKKQRIEADVAKHKDELTRLQSPSSAASQTSESSESCTS